LYRKVGATHPPGTGLMNPFRRSRRTVGAVAAIATLLAAAACERPDPPEPEVGPAAASDGVSPADAVSPAHDGGPTTSATSECVNAADGYSVRYPAAWHVNGSPPFAPCSFFDPEPLELPVDSEVPLEIAVAISVQPIDFATATGETLGRRDLAREPITLAGRKALRIEGETTGEGLHDRGILSYQYFVDFDDRTLIATTYGAGPLPFERKREALDAMMRSLVVHGRE
jgi:hypothetical protein